jgi:hypothetical protein
MIEFRRFDQRIPDNGLLPLPLTWDYCKRLIKAGGHYACRSDTWLAHCTCASGHTSLLVSTVHTVGPDGLVTPSYVCPSSTCTFHVHPWRLVGWDPDHVYETSLV